MANQDPTSLDAVKPDIENLYQEDSFTDLRAATIRRLSPVRPDGSTDPRRAVQFIGDTTLMTQVGPIPVQFAIEADTLGQAFDRFPDGVRAAIVKLNERAQELARAEASRIVVPGQSPAGGFPGGRRGGGGKLVID